MSKSFRKMSIPALSMLSLALIAGVVVADKAATFQLTINPGSLAVDVVDAAYTTVASPVVQFNAVSASLDCTSTTGTLGTASEQIYITNPDANDDGYTVSLAPTAPAATAAWSDGTNTIDFDDETDSGCATGQLAVTTAGTITDGKLTTDATTNISASNGSFSSINSSVTLVTAAAGSADISEVVANGFQLTQTIPARTPASSYSLPMTISILGN